MNGNDSSLKTNSKLDTFLKKKLEPSILEQVRFNESCIVVGERYDKVFSYVILGPEWIYITENPPKNVKEEVHYRDVIGIELKNDFPDFLGGQERTNTLHAVITYRTPVRHKGLMRALTNKALRPVSPKPVHKSMSAPDVNRMPPRPKSASPRLDRRRIASQSDCDDDDDDEFVNDLVVEASSSTESLESTATADLSLRPSSPRPSSPRPSSPRPRAASPSVAVDERRMGNSMDVPGAEVAPGSPKLPRGTKTPRGQAESDKSTNSSKTPATSNAHKESILHLYMLKSDSPIINHLINAWNNYLIRGTLLCDLEFELKTTHQRKSPHERLASLYDQLTHEIVLPGNSIEVVFDLMNELKTATEKNFVLKKFFWKYGDLFYFTVDHIKRYIPGKITADGSSADRSKRADELELVNLLLEILSLELRETDVLPQRSHCLRQAKGRHLADLIVLCTSPPGLPAPYYVPSRKASELLKQVEADENRNSINEELSQLSADFTRLSSGVMYELFLLAKQDVYCSGTFVNISWVVKKVQESKNLDPFVERIFTQSMKLISPTSRDQLSPREAVVLYQQLYVLKILMEQSPRVLNMLRAKFMEEFKYYIQGPVLWSKLPPSFTISKPTIGLLEKIMTKVLQKDVKLAVPEVRLG